MENKVKIPQEVVKYIREQGHSVFATEHGEYINLPFWYKINDDDTVTQMDYYDLPEVVQYMAAPIENEYAKCVSCKYLYAPEDCINCIKCDKDFSNYEPEDEE